MKAHRHNRPFSAFGIVLASMMLVGCPELPLFGDLPKTDIAPPEPFEPPVVSSVMDPAAPFPHELPSAARELSSEAAPPWTSGRAMAWHDGDLYVVDSANEEVVVVDAATGEVVRRVDFDTYGPQQIAVGPDGTAFVTLRYGYSVARISAGSSFTSTTIVGAEPIGIALSPDGEHVFATIAGENALVVLDAKTLQQEARVSTIHRPRTVALDPAGNTVVVAGQDSRADRFFVQHVGESTQISLEFPVELRRTSPADQTLHFARAEGVQANRARGSVADPESGAILVVHEQTMSGTEEDSLNGTFEQTFEDEFIPNPGGSNGGYGGGGTVSKFSDAPHLLRPIECSVTAVGDLVADAPGFPVRDPETGRPITSLVAQPSDINHHPTWTLAFVTGHGSDNVLVLNTADSDPMRSPLALIEVGQAPRAVVFDDAGKFAYVLSSQSFEVDVIDLSPLLTADSGDFGKMMEQADATGDMLPPIDKSGQLAVPQRLSTQTSFVYGTDPLPEHMRLGRRTYTFVRNERVSRDNQFACASCHFDGREDGLAWFVPGGPRQTPQLAGRLSGTGPFNWLGTESELQTNMVETIHRMGGQGLEQAELESLEAFLLGGLRRPVNPHTLGPLTPAQQRGRDLFFDPQVGCASCHVNGDGTNGQLHDVGTATPLEQEAAFLLEEMGLIDGPIRYNTPSLKDLFATAPYLHDGSAATLHEVLDRTATSMGNTAILSQSQRDDLVEYLLTL